MLRRPLAALLALGALALAPPARAEDRPPDADRALAQALDDIVARTTLAQARASIAVVSLETGRLVYARDPDVLLNPASNVKLFTSAAALALLGPEFRFDTEVLTEGVAGGTARTLYVRGKGDPTFVTERLWALAGDIAHRGVRAVKGDIVVDDSFFDGEREGPGYDQERGDRSYLAPVGALSLNWNTIAIHVGPGARPGERGRVEVEPASDYVEVENRTRTVKATARRRLDPSSTRLPSGRQRITVDARLPAGSRDQVLWRKIDDPPIYFGATLKRLLEVRGVKATGQVRRGAVPPMARLVAISQSESLGDVVRKLEKTSNNFVAEQLLKTLGAERKGAPGTWPKGVEAVEDFLAEAGLPRGSYVMKNGSGLNDTNRFSARQTVALLREMWRRFPLMADYLASLPIAGRDGTTRFRMGSTEGRLRAKTGTLENVTSLSGYVETAARERLAFSILVNDFPGRPHGTVRAVDALGSAIAAAGKPAELGAAVASVAAPASAAEPDARVRARFVTYDGLGRSGDPRNAAFLRTAGRTESDPVLRLAAAEALLLSDPDGEASRRSFLETVAADGAALPRLEALAPADAEGPGPVLGTLGDLAAGGSAEAMARLVEITPAVAPAYADRLGELWDDVAREAPEASARALRAAKWRRCVELASLTAPDCPHSHCVGDMVLDAIADRATSGADVWCR
ncbi:MAG TPA: D-alanyl-D-alanine carboxypeptidase/D-alanyl-D-alanine-endopeptidase [Anaeromyxobacteraceae bacterium]|nr:D-alanyl-D-alanine carboxypeptidase/D-alanyl-D-alanine-endopeptidase [Anaeromyxobacteraceae bacterium]